MYNKFTSFIKSVFPDNKYLVYGHGECGIVLSAPHGGRIKPFNIPTREYGKVREDTYTRRVINYLVTNLKSKPYFIYSDLHRSKLDLNRELHEAAQGNVKAENIWKLWNSVLGGYINAAKSRHGKVLYIDIHSQGITDSFHLGYDISSRDYNSIKDHVPTYARSTMYGLGDNQYELLFGDKSFSDSLTKRELKVFNPENDDSYFNGGRNVKVFSGQNVGGIQIEIPIKICGRRLDYVCESLTYAIESFAERFLKYDIGDNHPTG